MRLPIAWLALLTGAVLLLCACGQVDRATAHWTGAPARVCVDGVTYLQFTSGATVMLDRAGATVGCGK